MGKDPNPDEMPPEFEDLPYIAQVALVVFNRLGDRVASEIGYLGKDYTTLPIYLDLHPEIEDKEFFIEILLWLDNRVLKKSSEDMKRARDKIKRNTRGK